MIPKILVLLCVGGLVVSTFAEEEHVLVVDTNNFDSVVGSGRTRLVSSSKTYACYALR